MPTWLFRELSPSASYAAIAVLALAAWVLVIVPLWRFWHLSPRTRRLVSRHRPDENSPPEPFGLYPRHKSRTIPNPPHRISAEVKKEIQLEIAHVLFTDIVGYSKLLINEQRALLDTLNRIVRETEQFRIAEAAGKLIKIPTGDGMALVFYNSPEAPAECALEVSRALKEHPELKLRMGVHSGPVSGVIDVNERANVAGAGINIAQRVMDCGDAGHILLSKHVAEDLEHYGHWRPHLYDLGECEIKHGDVISVSNLYTDELGNPESPQKFKAKERKGTYAATAKMGRKLIWVTAGVTILAAALFLGVRLNLFQAKPSTISERTISESLDLPRVAAAVRPAVALIEIFGPSGKLIKTGTGFFVSSDGKLVTNRHVVEGATNATAKLETGATYAISGIIVTDNDHDVVLVQANAKEVPFLRLYGGLLPSVGSRIAVIGSPLGFEGSVSEGVISGQRAISKSDQWLQITAPVSHGSSGSPVVNPNGEVIGVATFIIQEGQALNFARPVSYVSDLLAKATTTTGLVPLSAVPAQQNVTPYAPEFASVDRCLTNGDAVTALKILNTLKEKYADSATLWFKFGYTYYELNLLEDAVGAYRHALTLEPADAIAWTNLGVSLAKLNRHQDAIEAGKQAIKVKPDYPKAWGLLGSEYLATERYHEATEAFNQAAQLDPSDPEIWRGLALSYSHEGNSEKSRQANARLQSVLQKHAQPIQPGSAKTEFVRYANPYYNFSAVVPANVFVKNETPSSNDRALFVSQDDRTKLLLLGKHNPRSHTLAKIYSEWAAEHTAADPGKVVDYKVLRGDWFVVSGRDGPRGFYVKGVLRQETLLLMCLEYDEQDCPLTEQDIGIMSRSFNGK
jgi:S1-C subfamily serine protease/Flp pilus assembly protein TadD